MRPDATMIMLRAFDMVLLSNGAACDVHVWAESFHEVKFTYHLADYCCLVQVCGQAYKRLAAL